MSRFSAKPQQQERNTSRMYFGPSVAEVKKKRSLAAKKAAATRKRNRETAVYPFATAVDNSYLDDLRKGLHKEWRKAKDDKPVILSCDEVISATGGKAALVRAACTGHATDFAEYVWSNCPSVYFDEVLKRMAQRLAVNGVSYGKATREQAQALASSLELHR